MNKETLNCELITPMFSSGMDTRKAELRASELKALMRYVYRISNQTLDTQQLYEEEARLFGDAEKHASPIRLQLVAGNLKWKSEPLLLHREKYETKYPNRSIPYRGCFLAKETYSIVLRKFLNKGEELSFYRNLVLLSLILGGMGKRSRRGRGCSSIISADGSVPNLTRESLLPWMTEQLNLLNATTDHSASSVYTMEKGIIRVDSKRVETRDSQKRPVIEEIRLGKTIKDIYQFLLQVDLASHEIKDKYKPKIRDNYKPPTNNLFATGYAYTGSKFASSLLISVTRTSEGELLPVYTFVKAFVDCTKNKNQKPDIQLLDTDYEERNKMISLIEGGTF
ncbi:RAMP superfamily CRISPR-associated protein [Paenibacillus chitinolyticus]|uniref:RAMP superfamily CRISPR-associated protein n=1 Tax=Paenibacillus chitinolyticus TaxID=79263 RepID=UPI0036735200